MEPLADVLIWAFVRETADDHSRKRDEEAYSQYWWDVWSSTGDWTLEGLFRVWAISHALAIPGLAKVLRPYVRPR